MYMTPPAGEARVPVPATLAGALWITGAFTLWIGVFPAPFLRLAQAALLPVLAR
jgi:hypothetical protein